VKEIRAIIRPNRLSRLREALRATVFNVKGFTAPSSVDRRSLRDELTDFTDKVMVCVLAEGDMVETIRAAMIEACQTGQIGDGLVWVVDIQSMHRVRDGSAY
jgi:nitrogen regulatory protein P-II 1